MHATYVPDVELDISVLHGLHVEANGWDSVHHLCQLQSVKDRGLACSIKAKHQNPHLFGSNHPRPNLAEEHAHFQAESEHPPTTTSALSCPLNLKKAHASSVRTCLLTINVPRKRAFNFNLSFFLFGTKKLGWLGCFYSLQRLWLRICPLQTMATSESRTKAGSASPFFFQV